MEVIFKKSARKELSKLDKKLGQRILNKVMLLENNPYPTGNKKLEDGYRIRIGNYRVVYTINKEAKKIIVIKIRHRKEAYR